MQTPDQNRADVKSSEHLSEPYVMSSDDFPTRIYSEGISYTQENVGQGSFTANYREEYPEENNRFLQIFIPQNFQNYERDKIAQKVTREHNIAVMEEEGLPVAPRQEFKTFYLGNQFYTGKTMDYNPSLTAYNDLPESEKPPHLDEEFRDIMLTLNGLKRKGRIAYSEDLIDPQQAIGDKDIQLNEKIPGLKGDTNLIDFRNLAEDRRNILINDLYTALLNDELVEPDTARDYHFTETFDPLEEVSHSEIPENGLYNAVVYNPRTEELVLLDYGELTEEQFYDPQITLNSPLDFLEHNNLNYRVNKELLEAKTHQLTYIEPADEISEV